MKQSFLLRPLHALRKVFNRRLKPFAKQTVVLVSVGSLFQAGTQFFDIHTYQSGNN